MSFSDTLHVYRHLTDDGQVADGTNNNANANGVITPVDYFAGPAEGKVWEIERMIVKIQDDSQFTAAKYGGIDTLANGVHVGLHYSGKDGPQVLDLLDGSNITGTAEWSAHCHDVKVFTFGAGDNYVSVRWTFGKAGEPIVLHGYHKDKIVVTIRDDLSTLVDHSFVIQGIERSS